MDFLELARKFGLGDFDIKVLRMAPKAGGKSDNFAINTDDQAGTTKLVGWHRK